MSVFYLPVASAFGQNVSPSDGAFLYFYETGTTTAKTTYKNPGETIAHDHPVVADSAGRFDAIFLSGTYKVVLKDKNGATIWTEDNITGSGTTWNDQGDFDSSTNSGDYPASGNDNDVYRVTEEFVLNSASGLHRVFIGDFIKANTAGATAVDADWDIIKGVSINVNKVALTAGATIATNCKIGTAFTVTLDQNSTLSNATNKRIGQTYTWFITQPSTAYTLAFGTDFTFIGQALIGSGAGNVTEIRGTVISATSILCHIVNKPAIDFSSKNLLIDVISNDEVDVDADRLSFINKSNFELFQDDIDETFDIRTDKMAGTSKHDSHWYQLWLDSAGVRMMVPDLTGTTDGVAANKLDLSTATFVTDKVSIGDIVYNLTDLTQTTVTAIDSEDILSIADDIFVSGEDFKIHMLDPVGLGEFKANIGVAYNNGSSNLGDSTYTQIQVARDYNGDGTDFTLSVANWTTASAKARITQDNDWTGRGNWRIELGARGDMGAGAVATVTPVISGAVFKNLTNYNVALPVTTFANGSGNHGYVVPDSSNIIIGSTVVATAWGFALNAQLERKPTFHT